MKKAMEDMLRVVHENQITSIAIPAIGIGVFKFPVDLAAHITADALAKAVTLAPSLQWARICLADKNLIPVYERAVKKCSTLN